MSSRKTHVGIYFCSGENNLQKACNGWAALAQDVNHVRASVANGVIQGHDVKETAQLGIKDVEAYGAIAEGAKTDLRSCLGRIANGDCLHYAPAQETDADL